MCSAIETLLAVAMTKERLPLMPLLGENPQKVRCASATLWISASLSLAIVETGIGKVNASLGLSQAIQSLHPQQVINVGVSGALHPDIPYAAIVCADRMAYHDVSCGCDIPFGQIQGLPLYYTADRHFVEAFESLQMPSSFVGLVTSGERFLTPEAEKEVRKHFPLALAGDMETAALAQTAFLLNTPLACLRLISDVPAAGDGYACYLRFWQQDYKEAFANVRNALSQILKQ